MIAILQFKLPEEAIEHSDALNATHVRRLYVPLMEKTKALIAYLDEKLKNEEISIVEHELLLIIRKKLE